jgi:hypothetical protein
MMKTRSKAVRRIIIGVLGAGLLALGLVMSLPLVPGPGLLVLVFSLAVLAAEFVWARWLLRKAKLQVEMLGNQPGLRSSPAMEKLRDYVRKISPRRILNSFMKTGDK